MARDLVAKIRLEADTRQAKREIEQLRTETLASLKAISAGEAEIDIDTDEGKARVKELEALLSDLDKQTVEPDVRVDTSAAEASLDSLESSLDSVDASSVSAEVDVDTSSAVKSIDGVEADLKRVDGESVSASVGADTSDAVSGLETVEGKLSELEGRSVTTDVLANTIDAEADLEGVKAQVAALDSEVISVDVDANTEDATRSLKETSEASSGLKQSFGDLKIAAVAVFAAIAAGAGAFAITIGSAAEQGRANALLASSLRTLGAARSDAVRDLNAQAIAQQGITDFTKLEITSIQRNISAFTDQVDVIKGLTAAALDLGASRSNALEISEQIARSFGTENNALLEQGIITEGLAGSLTRYNSILAGVAELAGGDAAAAADTFSGAMRGTIQSASLLGEELGAIVTESDRVKASIDRSRSSIDASTKAIAEETTVTGKLFLALRAVGKVLFPLQQADRNYESQARKTTEAVDDLTASHDALNAARTRSEDRTKRIIDAEAALEDQLRQLGFVVQSDLIRNIENAEAALDLARIGLRKGVLHVRELERAELDLARAEAALRGETLLQVEATALASDEFVTFAERLSVARAAVDGLTLSEGNQTREFVANTRIRTEARLQEQASENVITGGTSDFADVGGGTFTILQPVITGANGRVRLAAGPSFKGITLSG